MQNGQTKSTIFKTNKAPPTNNVWILQYPIYTYLHFLVYRLYIYIYYIKFDLCIMYLLNAFSLFLKITVVNLYCDHLMFYIWTVSGNILIYLYFCFFHVIKTNIFTSLIDLCFYMYYWITQMYVCSPKKAVNVLILYMQIVGKLPWPGLADYCDRL